MITNPNRLVGDYLRRLERAAAVLPRARRTDLVAEIGEHIDAALVEAGAADEVVVRNVLERLGPPEEIVSAAGPVGRRSGWFEVAALIALAIPFLGWFVGIVLVAVSRAWTGREKAVAVMLVLVPAVLLALGVVSESSGSAVSAEPVSSGLQPEEVSAGGGGLGPIELAVVLGTFLVGPLAAVYLASRLRRSGEPAEPASA